jgi:hypothetical protein
MGVCAADVDGDGAVDLYLTNYGRNTLLHNKGGGVFGDATEAAGVGDLHWSLGCAFFDADRDGWPDLYVANYLDFAAGPRLCRRGAVESNCPPFRYPPQPHVFYRNLGEGRFVDATRAAGFAGHEGRGMGVVAFDYDDDGAPDLVVANDNDPVFLFRNNGDGTFREVGAAAGVAYNLAGRVTSSMGVDVGDVDLDGRLDLVVTTFRNEGASLFLNIGRGLFTEEGVARGLQATMPYVGWGVGLVDYDNDGDKDLLVVNGHVHHNADAMEASATFPQPLQLLENRDGRFVDVSREVGLADIGPVVARGAAFGDYDNDGDVDILVNVAGGPALLLRNEGGNRRHWLSVEALATRPGRSAIGARVSVVAGGRRQVDEVRAGGSYASTNDPRLHFGLGDAADADVTVRWLDGRERTLRQVPADRFVRVWDDGRVTVDPAPAAPPSTAPLSRR